MIELMIPAPLPPIDKQYIAPVDEHKDKEKSFPFYVGSGSIYDVSSSFVNLTLEREYFDNFISGSGELTQLQLTVKDEIKELRKGLGISITAIAKALGVSRQTLYDWEKKNLVGGGYREKFDLILKVSDEWQKIASFPMGSYINRKLSGGSSLLDQILKSDVVTNDVLVSLEEINKAITASNAKTDRIKKKGEGHSLEEFVSLGKKVG